MTKGDWRRKMRALRDAMPPQERAAASAAIAEHVLGWKVFKDAETVFLYASMGSEADTWGLMQSMACLGKRVALPRVREGGAMDARLYRPGDALTKAPYGALEPAASSETIPPERIGLILAPCLAVTENGARLGYGGGFYDRFLAQTRGRRAVLCFSAQMVDSLPVSGYDVPMQAIIREDGILSVEGDTPCATS